MLSEIERSHIAEHGPKRCPVCRAKEIGVASRLYLLTALDGNNETAGDGSVRLALLSCLKCGHCLFFRAQALGLLPAADPG